jgi:hypothetical protein
MTQKTYISGYYDDDETLLSGLKQLKQNGVKIVDVLTPFPVHGLDTVLGYRRSWIARVGFIGGAVGAVSGFVFQTWVFTEAYPLVIGGKPYFAVPSFIPVTFECAVLFAAFAMVFAFLFRSHLGLGAENMIHDERITDDRFVVLASPSTDTEESIHELQSQLQAAGVSGITVKKPTKDT